MGFVGGHGAWPGLRLAECGKRQAVLGDTLLCGVCSGLHTQGESVDQFEVKVTNVCGMCALVRVRVAFQMVSRSAR